MGEKEIKSALLNFLVENGKVMEGGLVFSEMNLAKKVRRLDLGYFDKRNLVAIEIKSEKDSLLRLVGQVGEYAKYFDRVIVAVAPKFVRAASELVQNSIAIWEVSDEKVRIVRRGTLLNDVNKDSYVDLMTRREVSILARKLGISSQALGMYDLKIEVKNRISRLSKLEVKAVLVEGFYSRFGMASERFLKQISVEGKVSVSDVALLSPHLAGKKAYH